MQQGICNPEFYGDLVNLRKSLLIHTFLIFSNVLLTVSGEQGRHYAAYCMTSFNPIMVEGYAGSFSCTAVVQASDSLTASM